MSGKLRSAARRTYLEAAPKMRAKRMTPSATGNHHTSASLCGPLHAFPKPLLMVHFVPISGKLDVAQAHVVDIRQHARHRVPAIPPVKVAIETLAAIESKEPSQGNSGFHTRDLGDAATHPPSFCLCNHNAPQ